MPSPSPLQLCLRRTTGSWRALFAVRFIHIRASVQMRLLAECDDLCHATPMTQRRGHPWRLMGMSWEEKAKFSEAIDGSDQAVSMADRARKAILGKRGSDPKKSLGMSGLAGWRQRLRAGIHEEVNHGLKHLYTCTRSYAMFPMSSICNDRHQLSA